MGEKIPECWLQLESLLAQKKLEKSLIDFNEVEKLAMTCGIFDKHELGQVVQFLHDLGSLLHFNNEFLKNKCIINPQYIVDMMACLVSVNQTTINNGKLYHDKMGIIWKNYEHTLHQWILKLTERFDLTFSLSDTKMHLVPCLMPETLENDFVWPNIEKEQQLNKLKKEIIIFYHFDYLPAGLFNRLQVRLFTLSDNTAIWKNGSVLKRKNHLTLVQRINNRIELRVQGVNPENVLFSIHEVLEVLINESFNGVRYDFSYPCPDCIDNCVIDVEKSMFSSSLVRRAFEMKAAFLQCRQHFHPVSLIDLNARFPPDTINSFDLQFRYSIRDLKHYKQCLKTDVAIFYSSKDSDNDLHPRAIKVDLEVNGFSCWFTETPNSLAFDSLILGLKSSKVIIFCMSSNFVQDQLCIKTFNYVLRILKKSYILIVIDNGKSWQKSEIGAMVTDELYLKFNKIDQYKTRLVDLIEKIKIKITEKDKTKEVANAPKCFISYCWQNSHEAVSKGTMLKNDSLSLGKYDPRSIKKHLEKAGYSSWLDIEQVGKGTLFKDIVDGIRNCKVVIACVSNEYAESENCMKEYRFSANLKKPIIICIFGSSKSYTFWRNTELGLVSCLNNKEINFQIENPEAFNDLISELKNLNIETDINILTDTNKTLAVENIDEVLSDREVQFSELSELIQRKFLRQIAGFTDSISKPFPRLFVLDIDTASLSITQKTEISIFTETRALTKTKSIDLQNNNFCVKVLCEHEYGWVR
jgi:hypothetical protein